MAQQLGTTVTVQSVAGDGTLLFSVSREKPYDRSDNLLLNAMLMKQMMLMAMTMRTMTMKMTMTVTDNGHDNDGDDDEYNDNDNDKADD